MTNFRTGTLSCMLNKYNDELYTEDGGFELERLQTDEDASRVAGGLSYSGKGSEPNRKSISRPDKSSAGNDDGVGCTCTTSRHHRM